MQFERARYEHLNRIMELIDSSRNYMRKNGNLVQWTNGYPSIDIMKTSIDKNELFICKEKNGIHGVFCWSMDADPNYTYIEGGKWLNEEKYGVIHRVAGDGMIKSLGKKIIEWCYSQHPNVRIDTHESNLPMRRILEEMEFQYCGIIYVADGTPRLAFQKCE